jgi:hypothetical protein
MEPVKIIFKRREGGQERVIEGMNLTKVHHRHVWKHNNSCIQLIYANKNMGMVVDTCNPPPAMKEVRKEDPRPRPQQKSVRLYQKNN